MDVHAVPGKLKLKGGKVKKKKKDSSIDAAANATVSSVVKSTKSTDGTGDNRRLSEEGVKTEDGVDYVEIKPPTRTKTEESFAKRQAEIQMARIRQKAAKSHREKVEEFNEKMNQMTEFNDIPKISWTK